MAIPHLHVDGNIHARGYPGLMALVGTHGGMDLALVGRDLALVEFRIGEIRQSLNWSAM